MTMTDESTLWFGKHRGTALKDVPASYLLWYYDENTGTQEVFSVRKEALLDYIEEHLDQLEAEGGAA